MMEWITRERFESSKLWASDIETTGLLDQLYKEGPASKLHNMGFKDLHGKEILFSSGYNALRDKAAEEVRPIEELQAFLDTGPILIMHNGILYDGEALIFFGYDISKCIIIDTLAMAWYLEPMRVTYGLADYGEMFGIPKPKIDDWKNLSQEEYNRRVMQDCRIQLQLWKRLWSMMFRLYEDDKTGVFHCLNHLMNKFKHLRTAQRTRWHLDIPAAEALSKQLNGDSEERRQELISVMPPVPEWRTRTKPKAPFKLNGQLSVAGAGWYRFCLMHGIKFDSLNAYQEIKGYKPGNPNSPQQLKDWLFSLGWEPETFEYKRNDDGSERKIPQINIKQSGGQLDPGVERLAEEHDSVKVLQGFSIVKHRTSIVDGWLRDHVGGLLVAGAAGFTNTLRLRHREIVNVPSTRVKYGGDLRALLIAPDGWQLLGSDLSSLEDRCKHHYQLPIDPEYVKSQLDPSFDPHLEICRLGDFLTEEQIAAHKAKEADYSDERALGKRTNYGCQYGARPPRLARDAKIPLADAQRLYDAYWALNWSIEVIANGTEVKSCNGVNWQWNPVAKLWYHLKTQKDRFSTLCQGTGAYAFDTWVEQIHEICNERWKRDPLLTGQFHDEIIMRVKAGEKWSELWKEVTLEAIDRANVILDMRRPIGCDVQFGVNYSKIH